MSKITGTNEELAKGYREAKTEDEQIKYRNQLIENNLDFIKKCTRHFAFSRGDEDEFLQEGVLGFMDAIGRFKDSGHFLQCARFGIKKRIFSIFKDRKKEFAFKQVTSQRDPNAIRCLNPEAFCETSFSDTNFETDSHSTSLAPSNNYGTIVNITRRVFSIGHDPFGKMHDKESQSYFTRKLRKAFHSLSEEERELISQRYGFHSEPKTLRELSVFYGKTAQRIEQRQKAAEEKLRVMIKKSAR